jgi:hypothetical protein
MKFEYATRLYVAKSEQDPEFKLKTITAVEQFEPELQIFAADGWRLASLLGGATSLFAVFERPTNKIKCTGGCGRVFVPGVLNAGAIEPVCPTCRESKAPASLVVRGSENIDEALKQAVLNGPTQPMVITPGNESFERVTEALEMGAENPRTGTGQEPGVDVATPSKSKARTRK